MKRKPKIKFVTLKYQILVIVIETGPVVPPCAGSILMAVHTP